MIVDRFTKALLANKWHNFLDQVGLVSRIILSLKEVKLKELQEQLESLTIKD
jgi:hypothetical protein